MLKKMNWRSLLNDKIKIVITLGKFISIGILCFSCNSNLEVSKNFESNNWKNIDYIKGQFNVENVQKTYQIKLDIYHSYHIQNSQIPVQILLISPSKELTTLETIIDIKDANNAFLGDCLGDRCDFSIVLPKEIKLSKTGLYDIALLHLSDKPVLTNIEGVKISLVEKK
jgi:gliding motility-associated lipoprotein GldH